MSQTTLLSLKNIKFRDAEQLEEYRQNPRSIPLPEDCQITFGDEENRQTFNNAKQRIEKGKNKNTQTAPSPSANTPRTTQTTTHVQTSIISERNEYRR
ncbi:MAG: hypothetical protein J6W96_05450 [Alphaproteobacteria bacterium]|nr:hypothetical protein [Alphaproteobacteria bacterium]